MYIYKYTHTYKYAYIHTYAYLHVRLEISGFASLNVNQF